MLIWIINNISPSEFVCLCDYFDMVNMILLVIYASFFAIIWAISKYRSVEVSARGVTIVSHFNTCHELKLLPAGWSCIRLSDKPNIKPVILVGWGLLKLFCCLVIRASECLGNQSRPKGED